MSHFFLHLPRNIQVVSIPWLLRIMLHSLELQIFVQGLDLASFAHVQGTDFWIT